MEEDSLSFSPNYSFPFGDQIYSIVGPVKCESGINSIEEEGYEVINAQGGEKRCLRMMKVFTGDENWIKKQFDILKKVQGSKNGLKCYGSLSLKDKNNYARQCNLTELPACSLSTFMSTQINELSLSERIQLALSAINSFEIFQLKGIVWNEELSLLNFSLTDDNQVVVFNGFHTCEIQSSFDSKESVDLTYTFKKNCAQIKSIAFGILACDKELAQKHATPYNLQQFVGRTLTKNTELLTLVQGYSNFTQVFNQIEDWELLKEFLSEQLQTYRQQKGPNVDKIIQESHLINPTQELKKSKAQERISPSHQKVLSEEFDESRVQLDRSSPEEFEDSENDKSIQFLKIPFGKMKEENSILKNETESKINQNVPHINNLEETQELGSQLAEQINQLKIQKEQLEQLKLIVFQRVQDKNKKYVKFSSNTKKANKFANVPQTEDSVEQFNLRKIKESDDEEEKDNFDIESQGTKPKQIFKKKNQKKIETLDSESQSSENSENQSDNQIESSNQPSNTQQTDQVGQVNKNTKDEENLSSSGSNGYVKALNDQLLSQSGKTTYSYENSLLSDKSVIRLMIGILVLFIIFSIIFGVAFNFGVKKASQSIICDDSNCSSCPSTPDVCKVCKSDYYLSSTTNSCLRKCSVDNCETCISDYSVCEECQYGYTLSLKKCVLDSLSCPVSNCKLCKDSKCTECDFGFKLSGGTCMKKCTSPLCLKCENNASVCQSCSLPYTLNPVTQNCE